MSMRPPPGFVAEADQARAEAIDLLRDRTDNFVLLVFPGDEQPEPSAMLVCSAAQLEDGIRLLQQCFFITLARASGMVPPDDGDGE